MGSDPVCALVVFHESRETLKSVARHSGMVLYSSVLLSVKARCKTGLPFPQKPHPHGFDGNGCAAA